VICSGFSDADSDGYFTSTSAPVCFVRKPYELRELTQALADVMARGAGIGTAET